MWVDLYNFESFIHYYRYIDYFITFYYFPVKPLINRQIRSQMTKNAEKEAVEVFARNLKQLLLLKPVKGKKILGVDPGFKNGCKLALISEQNDVLDTDCIFPHTRKDQMMIYEHKIINMLRKNKYVAYKLHFSKQ